MHNMTDVKLAMRCSEVLSRVREYKDKMQYETKYYAVYSSQLRLYYNLKDKIRSEAIREHLGDLEKRMER